MSTVLQRARTAPTTFDDVLSSRKSKHARREGDIVGRMMINGSDVSGIKTKPGSRKLGIGNQEYGYGYGTTRSFESAIDSNVANASQRRTGWSPPLVSPRYDIRENPFNLVGFFPSRPGSPEHTVDWAWQRVDEEEEEEGEGEEASTENGSDRRIGRMRGGRSMSLNALDEYAGKVIENESGRVGIGIGIGILALTRVPSFLKSIGDAYFNQNLEDQPLVEPFDDESLCVSFQSRRVASQHAFTSPLQENNSKLQLFGVETTADEAQTGWSSLLYSKLLGPEV